MTARLLSMTGILCKPTPVGRPSWALDEGAHSPLLFLWKRAKVYRRSSFVIFPCTCFLPPPPTPQGLVGFVLSPDFHDSGAFYVCYTTAGEEVGAGQSAMSVQPV